jgi:hypothetical protein
MRQKRCGFAIQGETQQTGISGRHERGVSEDPVGSVIGQAGGAASAKCRWVGEAGRAAPRQIGKARGRQREINEEKGDRNESK